MYKEHYKFIAGASTSLSYAKQFIAELGDDIFGMIKAVLAALIPTALLIMETNMVANTKFEIKIKEELLEEVDKDY